MELSSKENQVHKVLPNSRQMQRTQQNFREASKPHIFFRKIKIFQTDKRKILQGVFEAYLKIQIGALSIQDTGPTSLKKLKREVPWTMDDTLSTEGRSALEGGRHSVSQGERCLE